MSVLSATWRKPARRLAGAGNEVSPPVQNFHAKVLTRPVHRRLLYASFWAVDGNFQLCRNRKGGGRQNDPSLYKDWAFWVQQDVRDKYLEYWEGKRDRPKQVRDRSNHRHWVLILSLPSPKRAPRSKRAILHELQLMEQKTRRA